MLHLFRANTQKAACGCWLGCYNYHCVAQPMTSWAPKLAGNFGATPGPAGKGCEARGRRRCAHRRGAPVRCGGGSGGCGDGALPAVAAAPAFRAASAPHSGDFILQHTFAGNVYNLSLLLACSTLLKKQGCSVRAESRQDNVIEQAGLARLRPTTPHETQRCYPGSDCRVSALQRREGAEEVWRAALGALLHLTTAAGRPVAEWASGLPPAAAAELLRCAERFRWCALVASVCVRGGCTVGKSLAARQSTRMS